jgi:hypothetical protein
MNEQEINVAIWQACAPNSSVIRNYFTDLNAMHEIESQLDNASWWIFVEKLTSICGAGVALCISSTAMQRAEAFLRTIGKWSE